MTVGGPTRAEVPPDTRPGALLSSGMRRGAVQVFLPVFLIGQALAWLTYAVTGWFRPWSWFKIGLAETLTSVRVSFEATAGPAPGAGAPVPTSLVVATGALTVAVVVLAFRAGREQGRGLERRPAAAAIAGAAPGLGFALPMLVAAFLVTLGFPRFDVTSMHPVLWQAFVAPLVVGGLCGAAGGLAAGGLAAGKEEVHRRGPWWRRSAAAGRGGVLAVGLSLSLAFIGFLVVAVVEPGPTGAYARFLGRTEGRGAALVLQHAALLPNQSGLVVAMSMGATVHGTVGEEVAATFSREGVRTEGETGGFLAAALGAGATEAAFPSWFVVFWAVPAAAAFVGGRRAGQGSAGQGSAGEGARSPRERALRGALAGVVFAVMVTVVVWASGIEIPAQASLLGGTVGLRVGSIATVGVLGLAWGVPFAALGALSITLRWPKPRPTIDRAS